MYSIVLALALAPGSAAPAADIYDEIQDLKRSVAELREEQTQARIDELKLVIVDLRQRITDDKLDELRRDVFMMGHTSFYHGGPMSFPMPQADRNLGRATVSVDLPSESNFTVNDLEIPLPPGKQTFYTPPLERGRDYFYDCKVRVKRDGKDVIKVKRLKVRVGEVARLNYEDMESR